MDSYIRIDLIAQWNHQSSTPNGKKTNKVSILWRNEITFRILNSNVRSFLKYR